MAAAVGACDCWSPSVKMLLTGVELEDICGCGWGSKKEDDGNRFVMGSGCNCVERLTRSFRLTIRRDRVRKRVR